MKETKQDFRDRLVAAEKSTPSEKYRTNFADLRERKMSKAQRVAVVFPILFCVSAAIHMAVLALYQVPALPVLVRIGLGVGTIVALAWAVLLGIVVKRGVIRRLNDPGMRNRIGIILFLIATGIASFLALSMADRSRGTQVLVVEGIVLLIAGILLIQSLIEQAELRTREKLLELQMEMQEAAMQLRQGPDSKNSNAA